MKDSYNKSLNEVIQSLVEDLKLQFNLRERALPSSRRIVVLSKQAVMAIHRNEFDVARKRLNEAKSLLKEIDEIATHPGLNINFMRVAYQEYVEANILFSIELEGRYPKPEELNVPSLSYLLGLADAVGEFRRKALDALRVGNIEKAEISLNIMEDIYANLLPLDEAFSLVSELRRKCDVARRLIEITRGDVTNEVRRNALEKSINRLEKRMVNEN
jgi:translin